MIGQGKSAPAGKGGKGGKTVKPGGKPGEAAPATASDGSPLTEREVEEATDKKRRDRKRIIGLSAVAFVGFILWWAGQPIKGPPHVGICRTFAELNIQYPETFRLYMAEQFERSWRLYYTYIGPFGENNANMIECRFTNDQYGALVLEHVLLNRVEVPQETIAAFNATIPIVLAYRPNVDIPGPIGNTLAGLKMN